jgi:hypothetical protein
MSLYLSVVVLQEAYGSLFSHYIPTKANVTEGCTTSESPWNHHTRMYQSRKLAVLIQVETRKTLRDCCMRHQGTFHGLVISAAD